MRRRARSESRAILRKLREAAEIGDRVFPLRSAPMPSVGARRSTRVFVPKGGGGGDGGLTRRLRSSSRVALSKKRGDGEGDEWMKMFEGVREGMWCKGEGKKGRLEAWGEPAASVPDPNPVEEPIETAGSKKARTVSIVYSRKRRRFLSDDLVSSSKDQDRKRQKSSLQDSASPSFSKDRASELGSSAVLKDHKYEKFYTSRRLRKKPKETPLAEPSSRETGEEEKETTPLAEPSSRETREEEKETTPLAEPSSRETGEEENKGHVDAWRITGTGVRVLTVPEASRNFAAMAGILAGDICTVSGGPMALIVLVESCSSTTKYSLSDILVSVLRWMRRARLGLWVLAALLFSESLAGAFSLHGIHFLRIRRSRAIALSANSISGCGFCKIYGSRKFVPLLSVDCSALPFYFNSLHVAMALGGQYIPGVLARYMKDLETNLSPVARSEESDSRVSTETGYSRSAVAVSVNPVLELNELPRIAGAAETVDGRTLVVDGSTTPKHQRKRSSLGSPRSQSMVFDSQTGASAPNRSFLASCPAGSCSPGNSLVNAALMNPRDTWISDLFRSIEEVGTPSKSHKKHKKSSKKGLSEGMKELKSFLAEVKQNIDSVRCNANILVTHSDRCWRERGAEVMLEFSCSKEWCIGVKAQGTMKYLHKPQDIKSCVVNRYTHAYMWAGEEGWKLEFCNKWDWYVFKELHMECRDRNMQEVPVKIIPIPGVRIVSGYEEIASSTFARSERYIQTMDDEVERALSGRNSCYDMDSGDEERLRQLNSSSFDAENNDLGHISEDIFEEIIFVLEKHAYNHPDEISDKERAIDLCQDLGRTDMVAAVFDYWLKKRNKMRAPLVKVFQGPRLKRTQMTRKSFFRKKRSFKKQRSQTGRCRQDSFFQDAAYHEATRRVEEARNAAKAATDSAIILRSRAQMLMSNADLAVYRSVTALRIARAKRLSESSDLAAAILD